MRCAFSSILLVGCVCQAEPPPQPPPTQPLPTLILAMSDFEQGPEGEPVVQPARAVLLRFDGDQIHQVEIRDPASSVFHKAIPWRSGVLTIAGDQARVVHWTPDGQRFEPSVLWEAAFGGEHDRIRDLEIGDVTGDGVLDLVVATHDQGIVAVGQEGEQGWTWTELGRRPDTFVHEIELGDLDQDGRLEIYATPSEPNRSSGEAQPGGVERWVFRDQGFVREPIAHWSETHAKEILLTDLGSGPALFAVKEGETDPGGALRSPAQVVELALVNGAWIERPVATLLGERQARFLVAGDPLGRGRASLVATGMRTGIWHIEPENSGYRARQIDSASGGFEQAALITDLDGDGHQELYVFSEPQGKPRELRRYLWVDGKMHRSVLHTEPQPGIVWGIAAGRF